MKRAAVIALLFLAFSGLADAFYLTQNELNGTPLICSAQSLSGCNSVVTSQYARIFNIPVAELGVLFYAALFVLAALEIVAPDRRVRRTLQAASAVGVAASAYFVVVQAFVIREFCVYCSVSALITLLIFACAILLEPIRRNGRPAPREPRPVEPSTPPRSLSMPPAA
ncbi:vitamin K epoxide reductase family protein [Candidatus Kaiserbacteria bacterium]|nr:vitamin K epoxide reductase family protein [Candidatus Kaiserbacteria bacterium]